MFEIQRKKSGLCVFVFVFVVAVLGQTNGLDQFLFRAFIFSTILFSRSFVCLFAMFFVFFEWQCVTLFRILFFLDGCKHTLPKSYVEFILSIYTTQMNVCHNWTHILNLNVFFSRKKTFGSFSSVVVFRFVCSFDSHTHTNTYGMWMNEWKKANVPYNQTKIVPIFRLKFTIISGYYFVHLPL